MRDRNVWRSREGRIKRWNRVLPGKGGGQSGREGRKNLPSLFRHITILPDNTRKEKQMRLIPYRTYTTKAIGVQHETNCGGIAIYELIGADKGGLAAVRFRYEYGDTMSYMRVAKIRWSIPRRKAADGAKPTEPIPYFNARSGRVYMDEVEACSPGWGSLWDW
jgi:hypothetical protein